jgi:hypothetical protein
VPPVAASVCEYAWFTVLAGRELVVIATAASTSSVNGALSIAPFESFTWTENDAVPAVDGVPEIVPPALRLVAAGRVPEATVHVKGGVPPDAASA